MDNNGQETQYHCKDSCNKCGGFNQITPTDTVDGYISEYKTECTDCGFQDYWGYGFYQSGEYMISNCKKYVNRGGILVKL